jgi:hypothetical protein
MKVLRTICFTLVLLLVSIPFANGQTTASATWALIADRTASVVGNVTATDQSYGDSLTYALYTSTAFDISSGASVSCQKVAKTSTDKHLCSPMLSQGYLQYTITPVTGNSFQITSISMKLGGSGTSAVRAAIYYSLNDPSFSSPVALADSSKHLLSLCKKDTLYVYQTGGDSVAAINLNVPSGQTFYLRVYEWIAAWTTSNKYMNNMSVVISGTTSPVTSVKTDNALPKTFAVKQNYPNPFNPSTTIQYNLPKESRVTLNVYSLLGQKVAALVDNTEAAGDHQVDWNARGFASGVYFFKITVNPVDGVNVASTSMVRKMMLLK